MKYLVFDVETTGLDYKMEEIIEFGYIILAQDLNNYKIIEKNDILIKQNKPLPDYIKKITKLDDDILNKQGITKDKAYEIIKNIYKKEYVLVAYNAQFDIKFLEKFFQSFEKDFKIENNILDVMALYKDFFPHPHKLCNAIETLKVFGENTHRAIDDCIATANILIDFENKIKEGFSLDVDIKKYINILGQNPKYPVKEEERFPHVKYINQYGAKKEIYNL